ncbi:uncharacterized protein N7515_008958 [Penicillium bovifimosum]|uniref:Uncharacterized protein n=1 Tax=Penicillium bovifimosum TaxID=126998 RepID=A0A9W9KV18_9EURO|nr:uncharacterized protein N7515_008958 [Penicillium bovifimosum]KAJ5120997.1 hypothetical protein N7515_008958 [Penicillium bovifimosum]
MAREKYIIGGNRGFLHPNPSPEELSELEKVGSSVSVSTNPKKDKFRRHCRRFWCLYLIGNVIFLAILLPIFELNPKSFLVVIPAVAQLVVNKADIRLIKAEVMNPTPESVRMTLETKINLKLALPVRLDPVVFYTFVRKFGHETPYAAIDIPGQTVKGNYSLGVYDQFTPLLNLTTWEEFVHQAVYQEKTSLSLYGKTTGYLGVLKNKITLDRNIVIPTLNKFEGFSIADATLVLPAEDDGSNLIANITLPNPTVLTFEVGTIVLDLKSGDTDIVLGNATITDVTLRPGNNVFPLRGVLDLKTVLGNLTAVLASQATSLRNGSLGLTAVTRTIVSNGTLIPYYTNVLGSLPLVANVGIGEVLKNTLGHLKSGGKLDLSGALSAIKDDDKRRRAVQLDSPVGYGDAFSQVSSLKHNKHVQEVFGDEEPQRRDAMIDSLARYYASL